MNPKVGEKAFYGFFKNYLMSRQFIRFKIVLKVRGNESLPIHHRKHGLMENADRFGISTKLASPAYCFSSVD